MDVLAGMRDSGDRERQRSQRQMPQHRARELVIRRRQRLGLPVLALFLMLMVALPVGFSVSSSARHAVKDGVSAERATARSEAQVAKDAQGKKPAMEPGYKDSTITLIGLGDMLFDRQVGALIKNEGADTVFTDVAPILKSADVVAGNLECPLSRRGSPVKGKDYTFRGRPEAAEGMKRAGITVLSLANNHMLDYGPDAMYDTIELLEESGISYAGAGPNFDEAYAPTMLDVKGKKVAFFAYSAILPYGFSATSKAPGVAGTRLGAAFYEEAVKEAADKNDYVVVSLHWGIEYQDNPQAYQRELAHRLIDAGADIILGHHPHVIQGLELYKGKIIAYSMGGFVFDHYSRKTGETFVLKVTLKEDAISKVEAIPIYMEAYGPPKVVTGGPAQRILQRLQRISTPLGTDVAIDGNTAHIAIP